MSEDLAKFIERLGQDPGLQERMKAAGDQEGTVKLAVQLGAEQGYGFTAEDVLTAFQKQGELSETELEQVTGGIVQGSPAYNIGFSFLQSSFLMKM